VYGNACLGTGYYSVQCMDGQWLLLVSLEQRLYRARRAFVARKAVYLTNTYPNTTIKQRYEARMLFAEVKAIETEIATVRARLRLSDPDTQLSKKDGKDACRSTTASSIVTTSSSTKRSTSTESTSDSTSHPPNNVGIINPYVYSDQQERAADW
jgi:hypothetical protein